MNVYECLKKDGSEMMIVIAANLNQAESFANPKHWIVAEFSELNSVIRYPKTTVVSHYAIAQKIIKL